jgi:nicotinate-nucleotide--dimethylbenzimidazole phosphoribosyltransferase
MSVDRTAGVDPAVAELVAAVPSDLGAPGPWTAALEARLARQTKPPGSLGRLEDVARQLAALQRTERPRVWDPQLVVFAADHGLSAQGVSAYPRDVTWQMVANMRAGGAAVSVLARHQGLALTVVDAGVDRRFDDGPSGASAVRFEPRKIAPGTADATAGPAMSPLQCAAAVRAGAEVVRGLPGNAVLLGEMGIGNTSSAALLMARLGGLPLDQCVGRGTGLDAAGLERKRAVLERAHRANASAATPLEVLAAFGGFEIAMLVGAALQAAAQRRLVVVDGFIVCAALLVATRLCPAMRPACLFSHRGGEAGHVRLLDLLEAAPLLDLGLRLGEGSGAALAWPLVVSSLALLDGLATFDSAGVSDRAGPDAPQPPAQAR